MMGMRRWLGGVVAVGVLGACEPLDAGGGGTIGEVLFDRGFAFVRDDRNIYVVDDDGDPNSPQRLTTGGGAYTPSISKNGNSIVFVQRSGSTYSLQTVPTTGGPVATLLSTNDAACGSCTNFRGPTFSPDGRTIVFAFERTPGALSTLGRIAVDGSGFVELTPNAGGVAFGSPSFFPSGNTVVAPAGDSASYYNRLAFVPLSGGFAQYSYLGNEVLAAANRAVVSPDGRQVALDARLSSGSTRIFVGNVTATGLSGSLRRLTDYTASTVQESFPSWVSSTELGFLFNDSGGDPSIYRAPVSSTASSVTLAVPSANEPFYGPN